MAGEISDGIILDSQFTPTTVRGALGCAGGGRAERNQTPFSTVLFLECSAGQVAETVGPYLDAGVDTLVFQPVGPQAALPELITAVGDGAARLQAPHAPVM